MGRPKWFEDHDPAKSLKPHAEAELHGLSTDLHQVIKLRFKQMEEHVQAALGWSSAQVYRFLADITQAVGRQIAPGRTERELVDDLRQGDTFHRMVRGQERLVNMLAGFTGQDKTRISTDMQRDFFMSAEEAKAYGIVDAVLEPFADKLRPTAQ